MFIERVRIYPALGKEPELRAVLEEWAKKRQAQGMEISLSVQLYGPEGPTFVNSAKFRDLAEVENRRRQNQADPAFQAVVAKVDSLCRVPAKRSLYEVLVRYPGKATS
ncbi:MAG: hypothetical protein ACRDGM_14745 [bacterium]